jgi:hypothetical protein
MGNPMDFPDYELRKNADPVRDLRSTKCWQHKPAALPSAFDSILSGGFTPKFIVI